MASPSLRRHAGQRQHGQTALDYGASINAQNNALETSLHLAATCGHDTTLTLLLDYNPKRIKPYHRANMHLRNMDGCTPLCNAAINGHLNCVIALLEHGAHIDAESFRGLTALHLAAEHGHIAVVEHLLDNGALIDSQSLDGFTALHLAVINRHYDMAALLLGRRADPNITSESGLTALHSAWKCAGNEQFVELLHRYGAKLTAQGRKDVDLLCAITDNYTFSFIKGLIDLSGDIPDEAILDLAAVVEMQANTAVEE